MEHLTGGKQGFRKLDRGYAIRKRHFFATHLSPTDGVEQEQLYGSRRSMKMSNGLKTRRIYTINGWPRIWILVPQFQYHH